MPARLDRVAHAGRIVPAVDYQFHTIRADLLRRADRNAEAALAYKAAVALAETVTERSHLRRGLPVVHQASVD